MQETWSPKGQLDKKWIKQIAYACLIACISIYSFNTEVINWLIGKYIPSDVATVFIMLLAYTVKKYNTDYSKAK